MVNVEFQISDKQARVIRKWLQSRKIDTTLSDFARGAFSEKVIELVNLSLAKEQEKTSDE
jgi:hypothetical protein